MLLALAAILACATPAGAWRTTGTHWPNRTITYATLGPEYDWSVKWAVYVWNASGANIRFVPASREGSSDVVIRGKDVAQGSQEDGRALTRFMPDGRIVSAGVDIRTGLDPYEAALVATHELGHVLGLGHENRGCAVMNDRLFTDHPFRCVAPALGQWWCQLLTKDDIQGAVRIYGGTVKDPKRPHCKRKR